MIMVHSINESILAYHVLLPDMTGRLSYDIFAVECKARATRDFPREVLVSREPLKIPRDSRFTLHGKRKLLLIINTTKTKRVVNQI